MTVKLSLDELKAKNAAEAEQNQQTAVEVKQEDNRDEFVEVDEAGVEVEPKAKPEEDEGKAEGEIEAWMQSEEATHEDDQKTGFVPNHEAAKRRKQAQALKGELNEVKDENQELRARIAALEASNVQTQEAPTNTIEAPQLPEDMYDEEAMRQYHQQMIEYTKTLGSQYKVDYELRKQEEAKKAQQQAQKKSLDDHYERAAKLVADGKVSEENYRNADKMVRLSLDQLNPGKGDALADAVISTLNSLGEGSEKVMYQLGVNQSAMHELLGKLQLDPSGNLASVYLGQLQAKIQTPSRRSSQAPAPSKQVNGEGGQSGPSDLMYKKYSKSTDVQERINLKQEAKRKGIDTSKW